MAGFPSFSRLNNIPLCVHTTFSLPLHLSWAFWLFPYVGYCELCCVNMGGQISLGDPGFNYFGQIPRSGIAGSCGNSIFNFLRTLHAVFYSSCLILTFLPTLHKDTLFSTSTMKIVFLGGGGNSHPNRCEVISLWF